jgi:hypothetical protein
VPDKTNWRAMLKGERTRVDLQAERDKLFASWGAELPGERLSVEEFTFTYPVLAYPAKPASLNLEKQPEVSGELQGIKGQYLILSTGVINMRKYGGYELEWESDERGAGPMDPGAEKPGDGIPAVGFPAAGERPAADARPGKSEPQATQTSLFRPEMGRDPEAVG